MSTVSRSRQASMAADPVSPDVAPTMVTRSLRRVELDVEQPTQQLQGHVLERQRGSVEQLDEVDVVAQLDERDDIVDVEGGVGVGHGVVEGSPIERARHEGPHDASGEGDVTVVGRLHRGPESRPVGGHVQPAVGCQTTEHGVGEGELGTRASRGDVGQRTLSRHR